MSGRFAWLPEIGSEGPLSKSGLNVDIGEGNDITASVRDTNVHNVMTALKSAHSDNEITRQGTSLVPLILIKISLTIGIKHVTDAKNYSAIMPIQQSHSHLEGPTDLLLKLISRFLAMLANQRMKKLYMNKYYFAYV